MSDNLFPDNNLSVDDILKEVRAMRQNASDPITNKQDSNRSDIVSPDKTENEETIVSSNKDISPIKENEKSINDQDKLKSFLNKTVETDYKSNSENVKQEADFLDSDRLEQGFNPFKHRRTGVILSPEEINSSAKVNNQIHNNVTTNDKANEVRPEHGRLNGFKIKDDETANLINYKKLSKLIKNVDDKTIEFSAMDKTMEINFTVEQTQNIKADKEPDKPINDNDNDNGKEIFSSKLNVEQRSDELDDSLKLQLEDPTTIENKVFEQISKVQKVRKNSRQIKDINLEKTQDSIKANDENVIEDYENIEDAEAIRTDLESKAKKLSKRLTFSTLLLILLVFLTILPAFSISLPSFISAQENVNVYLTVNVVLFALLILLNLPSVLRGIFSLFSLKSDIDTAIGVSAVAALIHSIYAFSFSDQVASGTIMLYTAVVALALVFNLIGKKAMISRAILNFKMVATTGIKQSCFTADEQNADVIAENCSVGGAVLTCSKSTINLRNFLKNAFCEDPADTMCQLLATIGFVASLACGGLIYYLDGNLMTALTCTVAIISVCVPLTSLLATNLPLYSASKKMVDEGSLLSGYHAVEKFSETDCVAIDAEEIFPAGSIDLVSLKSVGKFQIDNMILDAASLVITAGGPLADVFDKMIEGRRKMLLKAKNVFYFDKLGISGIVDGRKIKIGNRDFMANGGIVDLPDPELERRLKRNNNFTVYISSDDELYGLFVIKYNVVDEDIANSLDDLISKGITLIIKTNEPNITPELVQQVYEVDGEFIEIMPSHAAERYDEITAPVESSDSALAHNNSVSGFFSSIVACKSLKTKILLATFLQTTGSILAMAAVIFFALTKDFNLITPQFIFAFQLAWSFFVLTLPLFKRLY